MPAPVLVEACVDSIESALAAAEGGAHRIELCADLVEGGTTPSAGTLAVCRTRLRLPIFALVRPRGGGGPPASGERGTGGRPPPGGGAPGGRTDRRAPGRRDHGRERGGAGARHGRRRGAPHRRGHAAERHDVSGAAGRDR